MAPARRPRRKAGLLKAGTVSVWWMPTDRVGAADCRRWQEILDRDERERAGRFRFDRDRREFIAAHALLRRMLAFHLGQPAAAWQFAIGAFGKPTIDEKLRVSDIDFNMSHTRDLVAAAVVSHATIGVDVEQIDRAKADFAVAKAYFAPPEVELLRRAAERERAGRFFQLWTLKEAYLKATGAGLGTALDFLRFYACAGADQLPDRFSRSAAALALPNLTNDRSACAVGSRRQSEQSCHPRFVASGRPAGSVKTWIGKDLVI